MFKCINGELFEVVKEYGYTFVKIFYHNTAGGFFTAANSLHTGNARSNLYSRFDILDDLKSTQDEKYIFMLKYPAISGANVWKQSSKPQDDTNYTSPSVGYEPISLSWTGSSFNGISRSDYPGATYFDCGKSGNNSWYSICRITAYSGGFPGPNTSVVTQGSLWIATDEDKFDEEDENGWTIGLSKDFAYTGSVEPVALSPGVYQLECYGASGGASGGLGGYSSGYFVTTTEKIIYVVNGGIGASNSGNTGGAGGYNGGGRGGNGYGYRGGGGGGGATHIATTNRGILKNYNSYRNEVLIVAGGGGGLTSHSSAGAGGGTSGGTARAYNGTVIQGGTQTTGYAFGEGQAGQSKAYHGSYGAEGNGGAGAGWYGGYAYLANGNSTDCGGAGGSGYIGGVSDFKTLTKTTSNGVNSGNGRTIITLVSEPPNAFIIEEDEDKYDITVNEMYPFGGTEVTIQFNAKTGYTFKSMSLDGEDIPKSYTYTIPEDYNGHDIYVSGSVYTNPHIVVVHDGKVQSYVLSNSNPDIGTTFAITSVTMKEDWYFKNYVVDVNGRIITNLADTILTLPEWDSLTITLTISHDENRAPYYIYYYLVDYEINEFVLTDKDTFHGHEGNTVRKILRQYEGFHVDQRYHAGITTYVDIIISDKGNITSVYYDANEYKVTVLYGRATKYVCKHTEIITVNHTSFDDPLSEFKEWRWWPKDFTDVPFKDSPSITFKMPAMNLFFEAIEDPYRKNSNIYKNEYPYIPSDITYIMDAMSQSQEYEDDIVQSNHGLAVGDVVYYHDGLYRKALAEISERANAYAIVYRVNTKDSFAIQRAGMSDIQLPWDKTDSVIMYLSDTEPGKLVHYSVIQNKIYVPCAVWTDQGIIINMATGTIGNEYKPYGEIAGLEVDPYSQSELDETVGLVLGGV